MVQFDRAVSIHRKMSIRRDEGTTASVGTPPRQRLTDGSRQPFQGVSCRYQATGFVYVAGQAVRRHSLNWTDPYCGLRWQAIDSGLPDPLVRRRESIGDSPHLPRPAMVYGPGERADQPAGRTNTPNRCGCHPATRFAEQLIGRLSCAVRRGGLLTS